MENQVNVTLRNECQNALTTLEKLNISNTEDLKSKLTWCLGSFDYDKNPSGLYEMGIVALETLKDFKKQNPRKVNKKIIEGLAGSLQAFEAGLN
jgi:hypothetical protein